MAQIDPQERTGWLSQWRARLRGRSGAETRAPIDSTPDTSDAQLYTETSNPFLSLGRRMSSHRDAREAAHVTIRRAMPTLEDAARAASGLRDEDIQLLNLEETPPDMALRITDFLAGAAYALGGRIEQVGDSITLLTPGSAFVEEADAAPPPLHFTARNTP